MDTHARLRHACRTRPASRGASTVYDRWPKSPAQVFLTSRVAVGSRRVGGAADDDRVCRGRRTILETVLSRGVDYSLDARHIDHVRFQRAHERACERSRYPQRSNLSRVRGALGPSALSRRSVDNDAWQSTQGEARTGTLRVMRRASSSRPRCSADISFREPSSPSAPPARVDALQLHDRAGELTLLPERVSYSQRTTTPAPVRHPRRHLAARLAASQWSGGRGRPQNTVVAHGPHSRCRSRIPA